MLNPDSEETQYYRAYPYARLKDNKRAHSYLERLKPQSDSWKERISDDEI